MIYLITQKIEGKYVYLHLDSEKAALLIGKRGQTLNALENLTQLVALISFPIHLLLLN